MTATPYVAMPNSFRRDLRAGKTLIGCWASLASNLTTEILGYSGVDALFIGPSDLSAGYGHLGEPNHPEVQEVIARIVAAARLGGKPVGILAPVERDARRYLEMGMTYVAVGGDVGLLKTAAKTLCDRFKGEPLSG